MNTVKRRTKRKASGVKFEFHERLALYPKFKDEVAYLAKFWPELLEKHPGKNFNEYKRLLTYPPTQRAQYTHSNRDEARNRFFDLCENYGIAYFVGERPVLRPALTIKTQLKSGIREIVRHFRPTKAEGRRAVKMTNENLPNVPALTKRRKGEKAYITQDDVISVRSRLVMRDAQPMFEDSKRFPKRKFIYKENVNRIKFLREYKNIMEQLPEPKDKGELNALTARIYRTIARRHRLKSSYVKRLLNTRSASL